jgi:hypothetical protein
MALAPAIRRSRRERKQARRRARLERQRPARRHWERRRRGLANSAPELRHRPSIEGIEDRLIGGRDLRDLPQKQRPVDA